jgi:hypothetical protein
MRHAPAGGNKYDWESWAREASVAHDAGWTERAASALCIPIARGVGTLNLVVTGDRSETPSGYPAWAVGTAYTAGNMVRNASVTGVERVYIALTSGTSNGTGVINDTGVTWEDVEQTPTADLIAAITTICEARRPVTAYDYLVIGATKQRVTVTMTVTGVTATVKTAIAAEVRQHIMALTPTQTLFPAQISAIAIENGATDVTVSAPASPVTPTSGPDAYARLWPWGVTVS